MVTGVFEGTAAFGDTGLTSAGLLDIFVARYDSDGNWLWVQQAGGIYYDFGLGIATDGSGNSFVTGYFEDTATFNDTMLTSMSDKDIFLAKYDSDGNLLWVQQTGGPDDDFGRGIATDGSGNIIVTGFFGSTVIFGDTTLTSAGGDDIFIAKLNEGVTGIEEEFALSRLFNLAQNYPNPFNPTTNIEFSIPKSEYIILKVYNILGEEVATLVSEKLTAGSYKYDWDAGSLASGVYLYRIQAGGYVESKKMVLLR